MTAMAKNGRVLIRFEESDLAIVRQCADDERLPVATYLRKMALDNCVALVEARRTERGE